MALQEMTVSVVNWLKQQHVMVLDEWVQECVKWLHDEDQECLNNPAELQQEVYGQWIDADLTDISTPSLPNGIAQQQKGQLNGNYILQINSLKDVSTPAYSQLIKLRGKENENVKVTATQYQDRFEPQSNRMLMLQLTDGHQQIQGMEFEPIPGLSVNTQPGTKIQISGNIECRHGVLLLSPQHVRVLGGDVDALVEANNQDAVLAQALGQPTIPLDQQNQPPPNQAPQQLPAVNQQQWPVGDNQQHVVDLTDDQPMRRDAAPTRQQPPNASRVVTDDPFADDFGDDDDFDEIMLQGIEEIELQQGNGNSNNTAPPPDQNHETIQRNSIANRYTKPDVKPSIKTENNADVLQNNNSLTHQRQNQQRPYLGRPNQTGDQSSSGTISRTVKQDQTDPQQNLSFLGNRGSLPNSSGFGSNSTSKPNIAVAARIEKRTSLNRTSGGAVGHQNRDQKVSNQGFTRANDVASTSTEHRIFLGANSTNSGRTFLGRVAQEDRKPQVAARQEQPKTSGFMKYEPADQPNKNMNPTSAFHSLSRTAIKSEPGCTSSVSSEHYGLQSGFKSKTMGFAPTSAVVKQKPGPSQFQTGPTAPRIKPEPSEFGRFAQRSSVDGDSVSDMSTGSSMDEDDMVMAKRRRFYSGQNPAAEPSQHLPYSTLLLAERKHDAKQTCVMSIKGFIMTLVSSLSCKKGWNVIAKINDGTASMDVDLGNEVLTKLIGFSVPELMQMKKEASRASGDRQTALKQQMKQGLEKCQQALVDMSCIMTLEIRPEYERPRVLTIRDINEGDCMTLIHQL